MNLHQYRWVLLVPALAVVAILGCGRHGEDPAAEEKQKEASHADSGVVELDSTAVARTGIVVEPAGPATIDVTIQLPAEVKLDPRKVLDAKPRFAGVLREIRKDLGQRVNRGDVLAMVESNESLTRYPVVSSISGRVIARSAAPGQTVTEETVLCTVADLSSVWIEFGVYPNQLGLIRPGQTATVSAQTEGAAPDRATVSFVSPTVDPESRVAVGRVVLPNTRGRWEPGMFAQVVVTVDHVHVPVAVPDSAVVRTNEGPVVFVAQGTRYREQHVQIGRDDGVHAEIRSGLDAGTPVVSRNAFVLRSELEKSEYAQ